MSYLKARRQVVGLIYAGVILSLSYFISYASSVHVPDDRLDKQIQGTWSGYANLKSTGKVHLSIELFYRSKEIPGWRLQGALTVTQSDRTEVLDLAMPEGDHWNGFTGQSVSLNFHVKEKSNIFPQCTNYRLWFFGSHVSGTNKFKGKINPVGGCETGDFTIWRTIKK